MSFDGKQVLDLPMDPDKNDAEASSVREYLKTLLATLVEEGEGFSGKRPFGNSGWEYEIYRVLGDAGMIAIKYDDDGYLDDVDSRAGDRLILLAVDALQ